MSEIVLIAVCLCVCARARVRERERRSHHSGVSCLNRCLCGNTYELHHCVCHTALFLSLLELMLKLRTLLTVFTLVLKAEARNYDNERYISDSCL